MKPNKQTLYNVRWQKLRVSLLGGWTSAEGTAANIEQLRAYLSKANGQSDRFSRSWRMLNALNAVRMGNSGQGKSQSAHDELVMRYRDQVGKVYHELKAAGATFKIDSDEKVLADWAALDENSKKAILKNLGNRQKLHADSAFRGELGHFLTLIRGE